MEDYIASLLSQNAVSTFVIVRDDAAIACERRLAFTVPDEKLSKDEEWHRPSSFTNTPDVNPAPTIPARKESNDDLCLLSTSDEELMPQKHGFLDKFRGFRKRALRRNKRKKKAGKGHDSLTSTTKTYDARTEYHISEETDNDIYLAPTWKPRNNTNSKQRNSWDGTPLSPMNSSKSELDNSPPTLPLRKQSEDSLIDQQVESTRRFQRRSSLDNSAVLLPDWHPKRRSQRRGSLDNAMDSTELLALDYFQRRSSPDNSVLSTHDESKNHRYPRRGSLDNTIIMPNDEQTKRHFQRRGSLDNTLLSSDVQTRQRFQRRSSMDNAAMLVDQKTKLHNERRGSLNNASLSSTDINSKQVFQRRGSMDNTMMLISNPNRRFQRRSSLDNAMASSNHQTHLRFQRRSSIDNAMVQPIDQEPMHRRFSRRSSLDSRVMLSSSNSTPNYPAYEHQSSHENYDSNEADVAMAASVITDVHCGAPDYDCGLKQRILSQLNSPRWQEKIQLSSDLFQISKVNDAYDSFQRFSDIQTNC
mmetsp:Transcript_43062/g.104227  ORF Transcript_43062/g.104227 Transcript_43062/m.104227 type:complete len:529 (+) Transcript_43062:116-1702(+)